MCKEKNCKFRPYFNVEGEIKGLYCSKHKKENMVNVISRTCLECKKQPTFNIYCEAKALYCSKHKKEGMIDVKHKTCRNCKKKNTNF